VLGLDRLAHLGEVQGLEFELRFRLTSELRVAEFLSFCSATQYRKRGQIGFLSGGNMLLQSERKRDEQHAFDDGVETDYPYKRERACAGGH
jgi:hypothetical protein